MGEYRFFPDRPVTEYKKSDTMFILCVLLLWGLGIFTIYTCSTNAAMRYFSNRRYFLNRQLVSSCFGFAGFIFFAVVPMKYIRKFAFCFAVISLVLCVLALFPGIGGMRKGASRWISIPHSFSIQPSEIVKFSLVLYLAHLFDAHSSDYEENSKEFVYPVAALLSFVVVILFQRDLSTAAFVFCIGVSMFVLSGASLKWLVPFASLVIPATIGLVLMESYRITRIMAFFRPDEFSLTTGFQSSAAERAIAAGGIWGTGIGGALDKLARIPEVQTDYIFAGWATSMGLFGVTSYFILLSVFAFRGFSIAMKCPNRFASYASFCCTLSIFAQSIFNCAVVCGAFPTTGIPLPFFSYGGSSLIVTLCMCGFVVNASHCGADKETEDDYIDTEKFDGVVVEYE
jgi:cell division protein FtsW